MSGVERALRSTSAGESVLAFRAAGLRVGVVCRARELLEGARALLVPGWEECEPGAFDLLFALRVTPEGCFLERGGEVIARADDAEGLLEELARWLPIGIGAEARGLVFVHAGAVRWRGRGLVLPGASFAGKSTLVKALVDAGADYYSDEFAVLGEDGLLHAHPRPLGLRDAADGKRRLTARELGWSEAFEPTPIALVASLRYRPGAALALAPVSPGEGSLALLANTVSARTQPERALAVVARVSGAARFVAGERGKAGEAAAALLARLGED